MNIRKNNLQNTNFTNNFILKSYYPFGMVMPGRNFSSENYRFGFNGKVEDNEVMGDGNFQDYGLRMYNSRLGRFISVDPLTRSYPELTPFQFASNTPISAIDLDGGEAKVVTYGQKITSVHNDDNYIKSCGEACGRALGVPSQGVSTGRNLLSVLKSSSSGSGQNISAWVFYGHSWNNGLFLSNNNGFYSGRGDAGGEGSANFEDLNSMSASGQITFSKHSLFIFAGCGTAGDGYGGHGTGYGAYDPASFSASIGDFVSKNYVLPNRAFTGYYKITTIGATDLTHEYTDGTSTNAIGVNTHYIQTEKLYKIERTIEESGWWIFKTTKFVDKKSLIQTKTTDLGKSINPMEIIQNHNDKDTQIR